MSCEEAEELLGAYALDALPEVEAAAFRAHLATCADHRARAEELRATASVLPESIEPMAAPGALRGHVLAAIASTPQESRTATPRRIETAPGAPRRGWAPWRDVRPLQAWGALAAAIIAGLIVWNIVLQADSGDDDRFAVANATTSIPIRAHGQPGSGTAFYFEDEKRMLVVLSDVGTLEPTETYQMWTIADGQPASVGFLEPNADGLATAIVPFDADTSQIFAVTIEPAGGSDQPTSDPVLTAEVPL